MRLHLRVPSFAAIHSFPREFSIASSFCRVAWLVDSVRAAYYCLHGTVRMVLFPGCDGYDVLYFQIVGRPDLWLRPVAEGRDVVPPCWEVATAA